MKSKAQLPRLTTPSASLEKLDRLGWAASLSGTAYGVRLGIRVSDAAALALLPLLFPPTWKAGSSPVVDQLISLVIGGKPRRRLHRAWAGGTPIARSLDQREVLDDIESFLGLTVAALSPERVFVHAGVVAWRG